MASWFCPTCKTLIPAKDKLAHQDRHRHPAGHWSKGRKRSTQRRFREAVLARAGHQCQWVDPDTKQRCPVIRPLEAHHSEPGNDDPVTGVALCAGKNGHHKMVDRYAR